MPNLDFRVESAETLKYAAAPTLAFRLAVTSQGDERINSINLNTQIRIAARERHYSEAEQNGLAPVFGSAERWSHTLSSMLWTHTVTVIPPFVGSTTVEIPVACTYDFDVVHAKYFHALEDGVVPLDFLFSGTVFYSSGDGLQVVQIPWDREASFKLPVSVWKEMMEHYFPNSAWMRIDRRTFDRLCAYMSHEGIHSWEAALERLLPNDAEVNE